jgi:hypothetical protein
VLWYSVKLLLVTVSVNIMHMYAVGLIQSLLFGLVATVFHFLISIAFEHLLVTAEVRVMCY